jgi:hypothetical protein
MHEKYAINNGHNFKRIWASDVKGGVDLSLF